MGYNKPVSLSFVVLSVLYPMNPYTSLYARLFALHFSALPQHDVGSHCYLQAAAGSFLITSGA